MPDRDFNFLSLIGNAVLRWEYRPGSALFVVWQQSRSRDVIALGQGSERVGNFDLKRDAGRLFDLSPDNVLMVKFSYWPNP